ncbi:MAG: response regulator transcription factor [Chloroflexi bacterium]|nr:response regulator transcription factor [Chloroflexota bacterium]MBU1661216.1 response regulator transcription factor [Chloroflexota bacterium]
MVHTDFISQDLSARLRILIADDVQETRRSTRLILALNPDVEVVAIARDGQQAIDMAEIHKPDIAILDINMPKVDGISAFRVMRQTNPDMACIIISTEKDSQTLRQAMSAGAREYLIKPFTVDELNIAVRQVSKIVLDKRKKAARVTQVRRQREVYLKQLAQEYAKSRRSDDQALEVFERLATNPECELRWLKILAMIYVIRQKWGKLRTLAERLEQKQSDAVKDKV